MRAAGRFGVGLSAALAAALAASAQANLVTNGGFETGDFSGWTAFVSGDLEVAPFAHTGQFSARFGSRTVLANSIEQHVALVVGQQYQLDLWVHNLGLGDDYLSASNLDTYGFVMDPVATSLEQWELVSHTFTYAASPNGLVILGYDALASFYVDDISITLVPAPGVLALAGLGALGAVRRRR